MSIFIRFFFQKYNKIDKFQISLVLFTWLSYTLNSQVNMDILVKPLSVLMRQITIQKLLNNPNLIYK
jgi:hypothetical protein